MTRFHLQDNALYIAGRDQVLPANACVERRLFGVIFQKIAECFGTEAQARGSLRERVSPETFHDCLVLVVSR